MFQVLSGEVIVPKATGGHSEASLAAFTLSALVRAANTGFHILLDYSGTRLVFPEGPDSNVCLVR